MLGLRTDVDRNPELVHVLQWEPTAASRSDWEPCTVNARATAAHQPGIALHPDALGVGGLAGGDLYWVVVGPLAFDGSDTRLGSGSSMVTGVLRLPGNRATASLLPIQSRL